MKLAEANYDNSETGCCAKLDADLWEGRRLEWEEKPFLKRPHSLLAACPAQLWIGH